MPYSNTTQQIHCIDESNYIVVAEPIEQLSRKHSFNARHNERRGEVVQVRRSPSSDRDTAGVYLADQSNRRKFDAHFQGFGRFLTGSTGEYYFRTIKPTAYAGRPAPHVHFKVKLKGRDPWTTQLFVKGDPGNQQDRLWRSIGDERARDSVTVDFTPIKGSRAGELAARFDIVLSVTPEG